MTTSLPMPEIKNDFDYSNEVKRGSDGNFLPGTFNKPGRPKKYLTPNDHNRVKNWRNNNREWYNIYQRNYYSKRSSDPAWLEANREYQRKYREAKRLEKRLKNKVSTLIVNDLPSLVSKNNDKDNKEESKV